MAFRFFKFSKKLLCFLYKPSITQAPLSGAILFKFEIEDPGDPAIRIENQIQKWIGSERDLTSLEKPDPPGVPTLNSLTMVLSSRYL